MIGEVFNMMDELCLFQIVDKATHKDGNVLDLVFTNNRSLIHSYECFPTANSISHHSIVEMKSLYKCSNVVPSAERTLQQNDFSDYNYFDETVDWEAINNHLKSQNWELLFQGLNHRDKWRKFIDVCLDVTMRYVPKRKIYEGNRSRVPRDRKILLRRRRKIQKFLEKKNSPGRIGRLKRELLSIEVRLQASYESSRQVEEEKAVTAIQKNPKYFYAYAKRNCKVKTKVGPLLDTQGEYEFDPGKMADILQDQHVSMFSIPKVDNNMNATVTIKNDGLYDIVFYKIDVVEAIDELKAISAPGPDGISAFFLKQCKFAISSPLYLLYRDSLDQGVLCDEGKRSNIIPIHKGDSLALPVNYRPVSLTSHLVKILEKILRKKIVNFLEECNLFNCSQHGFTAGHSCLSQLLEYFDNFLCLLEEGNNVDTVYLDYSKAFDKVDHGILIRKLESMGINGKILRWISAFLSDRKQSVMVNGVLSKQATVISGVPQGTVLGPILFLIFIADIDEDVKYSFLSSFADDTRLFKSISYMIDTFKLQRDLNVVYDWSQRNNMVLNDTKFQVLRHGKDKELKEASCYLTPCGKLIEEKESIKDLGIHIDSDCSFSTHIRNVVKKMKEISGWILRTFKTRSRNLMLILWKSLVLPHHDYCSQLWSPSKVGDIQNLEMVQRSFVKKITGMKGLSY